jgi:hypothetical protein
MSGTGDVQVLDVVGAYRESGLPDAVFAAAVPKNYEKRMIDLLAEVFADHEATVRCYKASSRAYASRCFVPDCFGSTWG